MTPSIPRRAVTGTAEPALIANEHRSFEIGGWRALAVNVRSACRHQQRGDDSDTKMPGANLRSPFTRRAKGLDGPRGFASLSNSDVIATIFVRYLHKQLLDIVMSILVSQTQNCCAQENPFIKFPVENQAISHPAIERCMI